jgi:hypothetical protein
MDYKAARFLQVSGRLFSMKKIPLLLLCLSAFRMEAQHLSRQADSLANLHLLKVANGADAAVFRHMLAQRRQSTLAQRMDTGHYAALYIIETCEGVEKGYANTEMYFSRKLQPGRLQLSPADLDTVPIEFRNNGLPHYYLGQYYGTTVAGVFYSQKYEFFYTWPEIRWRAMQMQPLQELEYDPTPNLGFLLQPGQESDSAFYRESLQAREEKWTQWLKSNYQIITYIDLEEKIVRVSLQTPATQPKIQGYIRNMTNYGW